MFRLGIIGRSDYIRNCLERWEWGKKLPEEQIKITAWMSDHFTGNWFPKGNIMALSRQYVEKFFKQVDGVWIASAIEMHDADTILTLAAGKHVLCEKPLAATVKKCQAILAVHQNHPDLVLAVGYQLPFHQQFTRLKNYLQAIKPIRIIRIIDQRQIDIKEIYSHRVRNPGIISELGTHYFHFLLRLLDTNISNFQNLDSKIEYHQILNINDEAIITFEIEKMKVIFDLSWCRKSSIRTKSINIIGKGNIIVNLLKSSWPMIDIYNPDKIQSQEAEDDPSLKQLLTFIRQARGEIPEISLGTPQEGLKLVQLIERIYANT